MSRRSQRLTRYSQGDDDGSSSSGGSSVAGSQSTLFKDSPLRTLKRKSSNMKRLSPAPQLGPSSDAHTSYYSESLVRESYIGTRFPPRSSLEELHGDADWGEDLRVRRRRGTGGSESSRASGLMGRKATEDFLGSSSGYSSEDDYVGRR
ncbi:SUN2 isoform 15, partial [Pongo abelii]